MEAGMRLRIEEDDFIQDVDLSAADDAAGDATPPFGGERCGQSRHLIVHAGAGLALELDAEHDVSDLQEFAHVFGTESDSRDE